MFFDDRLATVLRQRADTDVGARTQFRQLLDILGNRKFGILDGRRQSLVAASWLRMDALAEKIPAHERAAAIRERGWRFRSADLAAHLADFEPEVAAAALNRADLSDDDWTALIPRLPVRARGFLRRRDDLPVDAERLLDQLGVHDRGLPRPNGHDGAEGLETPPTSFDISAEPSNTPAEVPYASLMGASAPDTIMPLRNRPADDPLSPNNEPYELSDEVRAEDEKEESSAAEKLAEETPAEAEPQEAQAPELEQAVEPEELPRPETDTASYDPFGLTDQTGIASNPIAGAEVDANRSEISALVERIAQFKRDRESGAQAIDSAPRLPLDEQPRQSEREVRGFGFATDANGRIEWAEPEAAPMVIGKRLVPAQAFTNPAAQTLIERAFDRRQPIAYAPLALAGAEAIAGDWIVDAQPNFADEGNFTGYVGRCRRPAKAASMPGQGGSEGDRIRQLLHELRTPVTAVQGYAEVIQQQLFGPAPHEYRALAAAVAADAARILAGFEELDRLAKLETGAAEMIPGETDLGAVIAKTAQQLAQVLGPRMAGVEFVQPEGPPIMVAMDTGETEALIWRVLATLGGACASGEMITCQLRRDDRLVRLICELPAQLISEDDLFAAQVKPANTVLNAGLFGAGFTFRLARAEARAAKGGLSHEGEHLALMLPLLTAQQGLPSHDASDAGASVQVSNLQDVPANSEHEKAASISGKRGGGKA